MASGSPSHQPEWLGTALHPEPIRDVQFVRAVNRGAVLELLRRAGPLSRTAIARALHLTPPTCFAIVEGLMADGLARCRETERSAPGRPRAIFEFNRAAAYSLGVDLSHTTLHGVLIDLSGEVLEERRWPRPDPPEVERVVERIVEFVREVARSPRLDPARLAGLGVATPALLDAGLERVLRSTNLNWRDVPFAKRLRDALGMEVCLENNVGAIALGERWFGAGRNAQHLACLNIGLGVSMSLIVNGMLHRGVSVFSGQVGHTIVDPEGLPCPCGRRGCLDTVAGGQAIRRDVVAAIRAGGDSAVLALAGGDREGITMDMIAQAADGGDPLAEEIVRRAATKVGYALSNAVVLLDPDTIVLSGSLVHASRLTAEVVVEIVRRTLLASPTRVQELRIVRAERGELAGALGAAGIVHQRRLGLYDAVRVVHRSSV